MSSAPLEFHYLERSKMNKLKGKIENIESSEHLSLVEVNVVDVIITSIVIETPDTADYLKVGNEVSVLFKETEVSIGKNLSGGLSLRNRLPSIITRIEKGVLLSELTLDFRGNLIDSIITTKSVNRLALNPGDEVDGLIKTNEITIMKVNSNGF